MKNIIIIITICFMSLSATAEAQTGCYPGDVGVSTPDSYAVADAYECIDGNLTIFGNYQITDLIFHNLREVKESIYVIGRRTPAPWQLAFLKLETVAGTLYIGSNPQLINIQLGDSVYDIGGFEFYNNDALKTLRLGALEFVDTGDFRVYENKSLRKIIARNFENIRGELEISDNESYPQCIALAWQRVSADSYYIENNSGDCP